MLGSALILGFLGSLHCVGMCGPIAFVLPLDRRNAVKRFFQIIKYHLGRLSSYALIGLLFGVLGRGLYLSGMQQRLSVVIGVLMVVIALVPAVGRLGSKRFMAPIYMGVGRLKNALGNQLQKDAPATLYVIGVLNGLLPCGLVYMALFGALAQGDAAFGSAYMALFGLGTVPLMSAAAYGGNFISAGVRQRLTRLVPVFVALVGVLFILRGLGLGIPYLSPADMHLAVKAGADCTTP